MVMPPDQGGPVASAAGATGPPAGSGTGEPGAVTFEVEGIFKSFGSSPVLRDVSLQFHAGEIHALVGENGAGKSTMAKIMAGALARDSGALRIDGNDHVLLTAAEAQRLGVTMIFQEPMLFPDLSVAENIFVERQPRRPGRPWLDRGAMLRGRGSFSTPSDRRFPPDGWCAGSRWRRCRWSRSPRPCPTRPGS